MLSPGLETLQAYASTIAEVHARETILPLRFGSIVESEAQFNHWLQGLADEWRAALDEVEGCDEMGLRVLLDPAPEPPLRTSTIAADRPGTSYLKALKARFDIADAVQSEADRLAGRLQEALGETVRRSVVEKPGPGRERLLSITFLVPRPALDHFRRALRPLQAELAGKLLLTGPWPPYGFVGPISPGILPIR
jgi:hypothetical protein